MLVCYVTGCCVEQPATACIALSDTGEVFLLVYADAARNLPDNVADGIFIKAASYV
jgi:phosphatidate phosphatase APP1